MQEQVRGLPAVLARDSGTRALGLWDEDELVAVAAFRHVAVLRLCRNDLLAVSRRRQRQGLGRVLKRAVLAAASDLGARAVDSLVARDNRAMLALNRGLGAVVEEVGDPDHVLCVIPLWR